ncbi:MAG: AAA family ATPase [Prochlorococcaceae cyanobacterium]
MNTPAPGASAKPNVAGTIAGTAAGTAAGTSSASAPYSPLAAALVEALPRLCGGGESGGGGGGGGKTEAALLELIAALGGALERSELELSLAGAPPPEVNPEGWPERHLAALAASPLVAQGESHDLAARPEAPLVLAGSVLRWRRWHTQLEAVLAELIARAQQPLAASSSSSGGSLSKAMAHAGGLGLDSRQQQAVAASLNHRLVLLSGGPGTGKTSTVVQMLAAALALEPELRLHLAAPTGKAATRLRSAIAAGAAGLEPRLAERLQQAPCTTLHRLLESNGERFGRHRGRPLAVELLVVDEASMVDLPLMQALLEALPSSSRLLLVGDSAQLPPVGPGAVLLELDRPQRRQALGAAAVELATTYRNNGAIAAVAASLRSEKPAALGLRQQLEQLTEHDNLRWQCHPPQRLPAPLLERLRQHQERLAALARGLRWLEATNPEGDQPLNREATDRERPQPDAASAAALLAELERCILLTPVRQGRWGVEAIHRALLAERYGRPLRHWPLGTPVLNQRNLSDQGLANGDIGVLVERHGERLVLFPGPRLFHPARLGHAEPALALTVHKAQGSEMDEVLILLPDSDHAEPRLLYTALTRARSRALLITPPGHRWLG